MLALLGVSKKAAAAGIVGLVTTGIWGSIVVNLPANTNGTGFLYVGLMNDSGVSSPAAPVGWVKQTDINDANGNETGAVYTRPADGSSSVTFASVGQLNWRAVAGYFPAAVAVDGTPAASNAGTPNQAPSQTSGGTNRTLVNFWTNDGDASTVLTPAAGQSTLGVSNGGGAGNPCASGYETVGSGATGTRKAQITLGALIWTAHSLLFR